jgi:hypothetical protein
MLTSTKIPERSVNHEYKIFQRDKFLGEGVWLAGGALRQLIDMDEKIADFDMFFSDKIKLHETIMKIEDRKILSESEFELVFQCPEGKLRTYKNKLNMKIQLVSENFYKDPEELLSRFDIRASRFAYDGKTLYYYHSSVRDVKKKEINFHALDFPNATMKRVSKYSAKGYKLTSKAAEKFTSYIYDCGMNRQPIDGRFYID